MTQQTLDSPGGLLADLAQAQAVLASGDATEWATLDDDELLAGFAVTQTINAMARSLELRAIAELERRKVTSQRHGVETAEWWQAQGNVAGRSARLSVRHARELEGFPLVERALATGNISAEQSMVLVGGLTRLPADAPEQAVVDAQEYLLEQTGGTDLASLRRIAMRVADVVLPDQAQLSQADAVAEQQQRARRGRYFAYGRDEADAVVWFRGRVPTAEGEVLIAALNALAQQAWRNEAATRVAQRGAQPTGSPGEVDQELSSMAQLRADALIELASRREGTPMPARLTVLTSMADLTSELGMGTLMESGELVSPAELRRLACDAGILPAVLDGRSAVVDLGRERRLVTAELRQVLMIRDQGCVFPGCDRPPGECEAHHLVPWAQGGNTDRDNLVLLCPHHHRMVEPHPRSVPGARWQVQLGADGLAEVVPPSRVDPGRRPVRHRRYEADSWRVRRRVDQVA